MEGRNKRVERELSKGASSPQFEFFDDVDGLFGDKGNCYLRFCPKNGRYIGQIHVLQIKFVYGKGTVYKYPMNPPNITFITPIWHANVYGGGAICLDILRDDKWSAMQDIDSVFTSLQLLLDDPNPASPANGAAGADYKKLTEKEFQEKSTKHYLQTMMAPTFEHKQAIPLIQSDAFKSGIVDMTNRDHIRATIMGQLGL